MYDTLIFVHDKVPISEIVDRTITILKNRISVLLPS